jgi:hypothetical protein
LSAEIMATQNAPEAARIVSHLFQVISGTFFS